MKLNRKGYTLIELLAVILIIGLILGFSTYGIINAFNTSKNKSLTISINSIKEAAETYATEKNDDSSYWLDIIDKENKYFCITIEELMNKGLLDKKANIKSKDFDIHSYVLVKKNKVTFVNSKAEILTKDKANSDGYKVCMGNIVNEEVTVYPKLDNGTSYTDEIHVGFTDAKTNSSSTMSDKVCMYGDSSANIKETGVIEGNTCKLQGLKQNEKYYLRVCMKTSRGSYLCSNTESRSTLLVKKPTYTLSSNTLTIKYNNANINGEAKYYFKSTIKGTSNINVKRCTLSNNIFTCDGNTTTIEKDTWYQSSSNQINISYTTTGKVKVTARTVDKSNNYSESTKNFKVVNYTVTFDPLGGKASFTTKKVKPNGVYGDLPTATKRGYTLVGWSMKNLFYYKNIIENDNLSYTNGVFKQKSADTRTELQWKIQGFKGNEYVKNLTATKVQKYGTVYLTFTKDSSFDNLRFGINGAKIDTLVRFDAYSLTDGKTYTISAKILNSTQGSVSWNNLQLEEGRTATTYQEGTISSSTKVTANSDHTVYALWTPNTYTITYNANGGAGSMGNTVVNYGTNTTIRNNTFTKTGYTFAGWTTRTDGVDDGYNWTGWSGTWKYVDGQYGISNNTLKLYAIWKDTTPPSMDYGPSTETTWCTGKEVWVSCSDSGSGMKETYMNDNGTVTTGTTYTSQGMSARSGNKKTYLRCTDNAGNVTEKTIWNYYVKDRYCSSTYYCRRAEFGCETYNARAAYPCSCKNYTYSDWKADYTSKYTLSESACKAKSKQEDLQRVICTYKQRTCNCGYWSRTKYCSSYNTCRNAAFGCQTYNQGNCGCNSYSCSY
jgi:prepilin-type N-terminal cleavage/methylation domain-containing protein